MRRLDHGLAAESVRPPTTSWGLVEWHWSRHRGRLRHGGIGGRHRRLRARAGSPGEPGWSSPDRVSRQSARCPSIETCLRFGRSDRAHGHRRGGDARCDRWIRPKGFADRIRGRAHLGIVRHWSARRRAPRRKTRGRPPADGPGRGPDRRRLSERSRRHRTRAALTANFEPVTITFASCPSAIHRRSTGGAPRGQKI